MPPAPREVLLRALDLARRAPSAHNAQPWRLTREGERLVVSADPARMLGHTDPTGRDLALSLGAFAAALELALESEGFRYRRAEPPAGAFAALEPGGACAPAPGLASLLRRRATSRLPYSPRDPDAAAVGALGEAAKEHGLSLHLAARGTELREQLSRLFFAAARESWLDARAVAELAPWVRFDPEGLRAPHDGLSTHCLGLSLAASAGLVALMQPALWRAAGAVYAAPWLAERAARAELDAAERAPFIAVVTCHGEARAQGGALLRLWLEATRLGLALHPLSVMLDRRGWEVARALGAGTSNLVFAARLGRSAPPPRSGRLPVERFASI